MNQTGNLAIICAQRNDILFQIRGGEITVMVCNGSHKAALTAASNDEEKINEIIRELNFGKLRSMEGEQNDIHG